MCDIIVTLIWCYCNVIVVLLWRHTFKIHVTSSSYLQFHSGGILSEWPHDLTELGGRNVATLVAVELVEGCVVALKNETIPLDLIYFSDLVSSFEYDMIYIFTMI